MWKEALRNSSIILAGVISSRFFVFLYNTIIIRELSVSDYASFAFAMAVFNWVLVFSHLDLYAAVSWNVSKFKAMNQLSDAWNYYRHAFIMAGIFAFVGMIVGILITNSQGVYSNIYITVFMISLLPMSLVTVNDGYLKGFEKFRLSAMVELSSGLSKLLVLVLAIFIMKSINLSAVFVLFTIASLIIYLISNTVIIKSNVRIVTRKKKISLSIAKKLFDYSRWVCLTDLMNAGILLSGNMIISHKNPTDLAAFNIVILIYGIFQMAFGAITTVLIPQVSRQDTNKQKVHMLGIRDFFVVSLLTIISIAILIRIPWSHDIILFLFKKPDYSNAFNYLSILMVALPFRLFSVANKGILQGIGHPKLAAITSIFTLMINIILFFYLYNIFSISGSMIAMVCAYIVDFIIITIMTYMVLSRRKKDA